MLVIPFLCTMFIRQTKKSNSKKGKVFFQYVLVQAQRVNGTSRQRNVLYLGSDKFLEDKLLRKKIAKALEQKIYNTLDFSDQFSYYTQLDAVHRKWVDDRYAKYLDKQQQLKEGQSDQPPLSMPADAKTATFEEVDTSSVGTSHCREAGAEWMCLKMAEELNIEQFLQTKEFKRQQIELALISIISRAVFPASERKTAQLLEQNSALWELLPTMEAPPDRFALYRSAAQLSEHFDDFTDFIYKSTMDLFSLKDTLMIYDLTNAYFEGRKLNSLLAQFGRSKEKRNDCKIVSFSAVVNQYGFLRYSKIEKGNIADSKTLLGMIKQMKQKSNTGNLDKVVVMDAGIVNEANLKELRKNGEQYVCVSPVKLKDYQDYISKDMTTIFDKKKNKIEVKLIDPDAKPDKWLLVKSDMKAKKELAIKSKAETKFEQKLTLIEQGIHKKQGTKKIEKVWERIGRAKENCKRVYNKYDIEVKEQKGNAVEITWRKKQTDQNNHNGVYFIRTNLEHQTDEQIWNIYNTIREVESTFRCLKTDLRIRPIFHKKDKYSKAHIHLGLMAYQLVAAIRHRLKSGGIHSAWSSIVEIMNSQKMNTIQMKMKTKEVHIRKISVPEEPVKQLHQIMGIKHFPKPVKKYVMYH